MALTDKQQAYLMLAVFVIPSLIAWFTLGAPLDRTALAYLGAAILSGVLAFIKEYLGIVGTPSPAPSPPSSPPQSATAAPAHQLDSAYLFCSTSGVVPVIGTDVCSVTLTASGAQPVFHHE